MMIPEPQRELGLVTRAQAHADGLTDEAIAWRLASGRWQRLYRGIYVTRPGPLGWLSRASGVLLACGPGAVLTDQSAAFLHRVVEGPGPVVCVAIPDTRRVLPPEGALLRRARGIRPGGVAWPPRTSVEATVIDLAARVSIDDVAAIVARSLQHRLTTPQRLLAELESRARHPRRRLVAAMVGDVRNGNQSCLEVRFVTGVLRRHGLPLGQAQFPLGAIDPALSGRRADRGYPAWRLLIELDGIRFHQGSALVNDRLKSNRAAVLGWVVVRFGWPEAVERPCETALDLARIFWSRGWTGSPRACSPSCQVEAMRQERPAARTAEDSPYPVARAMFRDSDGWLTLRAGCGRVCR